MIFGTGTQSVVEEDYWCWQCALQSFPSNKFPSPLDGLEGLYTDAWCQTYTAAYAMWYLL